jgi:[acyl-carrier-protein] S-malonyltransferase
MHSMYMFPGLGADYPGMLGRFTERHSWADALLARWGELAGIRLNDADPDTSREQEMLRQFRIHAMNLLWWRAVRPEPGADYGCCGHSLGFYAALVAAGALSEESSFLWLKEIFAAGWAEFADNPDRIAVVTTHAPLEPQAIAREFALEVLAVNGPCQILAYGAAPALDGLCRSLESAGSLLRRADLPARIPFHSRAMAPVCERVAARAAALGLSVGEPGHALWSHLTGERIGTARDALATLVEQPRRPVLWQTLIENLSAERYDEFVEVGPSRVLSQLVRWNDPATPVRYVDNLRKAGPATGAPS